MHTDVWAQVCVYACMCEGVLMCVRAATCEHLCACVRKQGADGGSGWERCDHEQMDSLFR